MGEIVNKIQQSGLIQLDLAEYKPKETIETIDLKENLWQGLALKEKDFREFVKTNEWTKYDGKVVGVFCSTDAIVPTWAYMLVISRLQDEGVTAFVGDKEEVEKQLILSNISAIDLEKYNDGRLIIKGCSDVAHPAFAMSELVKRLQPVAKSIMYGEPCSTVPVYKRKK
ncbi:MAG TPA: DUF2480 family protein [Brumimicrobium sp.]|nr:DUF2480 family protein [Brumimicrobium sp.]